MTDADAAADSAPIEHIDLELELPDTWTITELGESDRDAAEAEMAELLDGKVDDPQAVAESSMIEFFERLGAGGNAPLLFASLRFELDDDSILAASLIVSKNDVAGQLDAWRDAYPDSTDVTVDGEPAVRTFEQSHARVEQLFDEPLTVCTWRYIVPFERSSVLMFSFSSANHELTDILQDHFDEIMSTARIGAA